jgi:hypothetical protein
VKITAENGLWRRGTQLLCPVGVDSDGVELTASREEKSAE